MKISAKEIAQLLNATVEGNPDTVITKLARIEEADEQSFCFLANPKYFSYAQTAKVGVLLCNETLEYNTGNVSAAIRVADPYAAFQKLMELYASVSTKPQVANVHPQAVFGNQVSMGSHVSIGALSYIGNNVQIGNNVVIHANCSIGDGAVIMDDTVIYSNVSVYKDCVIGKRCVLHSGCVIGSDGFGFAPQQDGSYKKIPQTGNVVLGDDVEVGANTCIDRAVMGSTKIGNGVKLDNLIQVAHNVEIGDHTVIAAQAGISGSTRLGKNMMIGGQAGITGHLTIADGVKVQAKAAVIKDVAETGKGLSGIPAIDAREHYRILASMKVLPQLISRVKELEKKLQQFLG